MHLKFEIIIETIIEISSKTFNILVFQNQNFNRFLFEIEFKFKIMQSKSNLNLNSNPLWFHFEPDRLHRHFRVNWEVHVESYDKFPGLIISHG